MCIIDCLSTIVFILPLYLDDTKVIILILWRRTFQLEYWRTFQLVSTAIAEKDNSRRAYIAALYNYWNLYYGLRSLTGYDFEKMIPITEDYELLLNN